MNIYIYIYIYIFIYIYIYMRLDRRIYLDSLTYILSIYVTYFFCIAIIPNYPVNAVVAELQFI